MSKTRLPISTPRINNDKHKVRLYYKVWDRESPFGSVKTYKYMTQYDALSLVKKLIDTGDYLKHGLPVLEPVLRTRAEVEERNEFNEAWAKRRGGIYE